MAVTSFGTLKGKRFSLSTFIVNYAALKAGAYA